MLEGWVNHSHVMSCLCFASLLKLKGYLSIYHLCILHQLLPNQCSPKFFFSSLCIFHYSIITLWTPTKWCFLPSRLGIRYKSNVPTNNNVKNLFFFIIVKIVISDESSMKNNQYLLNSHVYIFTVSKNKWP